MAGKYLKKETQIQVQEKKNRKKQVLHHLWKWITAAVLLAVLLLNAFTHIVQIVRYNGIGMEPALQGGKTLVIQKTKKVSEGDIVAFYFNNQVLVRRVICTGGKELELDSDGYVSINGIKLEEPYVKDHTLGQCNLTFPYQVRTDTVFVMGDNRVSAMDSRLEEIGTIPVDRIIGKMILCL